MAAMDPFSEVRPPDRESGPVPPPGPSETRARPVWAMAFAFVLVLSGLSFAVVTGATPPFSTSVLEDSGNFFALAETGTTLYAASGDGGSILLEQSSDHGTSWTESPVPYDVVAGGSPWMLATVAGSGSDLVIAATTGVGTVAPGPGVPGVPYSDEQCFSNSSVLLAYSADGGLAWNVTTFYLDNLSATSLEAEINGGIAAVVWSAVPTGCAAAAGAVQAVTSPDGGVEWSAVQNLTPTNGRVPPSAQVEMAPDEGGLVVAFGSVSPNGSVDQLRLWGLTPGNPTGFVPLADLPAPSSWTLQGASSTPAYLLTPTYLIPLAAPPYTALPFSQLQSDGNGLGELPTVVSLVPRGSDALEIAATLPGGLGVDCWHIVLDPYRVTQTCHVPLTSGGAIDGDPLPIVALIDDGNGWVAVGAAGSNGAGCSVVCDDAPTSSGAESSVPAAGIAVGTSVCLTGCSASAGLAAYSYVPSPSTGLAEVVALGTTFAGVLGLIAMQIAYRRGYPSARAGRVRATPPASTDPSLGRGGVLLHRYRSGLLVWALAWTPAAAVAFLPSYGGDPRIVDALIVAGGFAGIALTALLHGEVRRRLQSAAGATIDQLFADDDRRLEEAPYAQARQVAVLAYSSWLGAVAFVTLLWVAAAGGFGSPPFGAASAPGPLAGTTVGGILVAASLGFTVVVRGLYHRALAAAVSAARTRVPAPPGTLDRIRWRTDIGAACLVVNPLAGLGVGYALAGALPVGPETLGLACLPVTLLGLALLGGWFGPSAWSADPSNG